MKNRVLKDSFIINVIFVTIITFSIEIIFKIISSYTIFDFSTLRIFFSTLILSIIITFLSSLCKKKWIRNIINLLYIFIYAFYTWLQLGFLNYLGVYMSFNTSSQLGAVKDYIWDFLDSIKGIFYVVYIPFVVAVLVYILFRKLSYKKNRFSKYSIYALVVLILSIFVYYETITLPFMQNKYQIKSNKLLFRNPDVPTVAVNQFGTATFGILDLKSFILPVDEEELAEVEYNENKTPVKISRQVPNVLEQLKDNESNRTYAALNNYFASQKVTDFNDYSGTLKGKNVVVLLLESANDAMINEEEYPNFYKMYSEGYHWKNSYSPRNSCATGNNEFSAMTGLYSIYNTCTSNTYKNNTYFESIFGLFNDAGYNTTSFHDFVEWYYRRKTIHPNMGSGHYYNANDMGIKTASYYGEWPSDVEMMDKAFDIIYKNKGDQPFMTFMTTVTGHQPYTNSSTQGDLYKDHYREKGYSNPVSRYLSKLKVTDNALGRMMEILAEKGDLENTVFVMFADHYPYGLNKTYVKEMIKYDIGDYDIEKTPFVIYNSTMEGKEFEEYTSYLNIVPTLANLLGLDYDPRLYMGTDLLSEDYESRVVFADGSWKNEKAYYNASTSKIKYYVEGAAYTPDEIQAINQKIRNQIDMSSKAIKSNYFNYLKKKYDELLPKEEEVVETTETEVQD